MPAGAIARSLARGFAAWLLCRRLKCAASLQAGSLLHTGTGCRVCGFWGGGSARLQKLAAFPPLEQVLRRLWKRMLALQSLYGGRLGGKLHRRRLAQNRWPRGRRLHRSGSHRSWRPQSWSPRSWRRNCLFGLRGRAVFPRKPRRLRRSCVRRLPQALTHHRPLGCVLKLTLALPLLGALRRSGCALHLSLGGGLNFLSPGLARIRVLRPARGCHKRDAREQCDPFHQLAPSSRRKMPHQCKQAKCHRRNQAATAPGPSRMSENWTAARVRLAGPAGRPPYFMTISAFAAFPAST